MGEVRLDAPFLHVGDKRRPRGVGRVGMEKTQLRNGCMRRGVADAPFAGIDARLEQDEVGSIAIADLAVIAIWWELEHFKKLRETPALLRYVRTEKVR